MRTKPPVQPNRYLKAAAYLLKLCMVWTWLTPFSLQGQEPVNLSLGANFQAIVDANPPGTTYIIASGIHRAQSIIPKDGDVITGAPGAILNGCLLLQNWQQEGDWWVHLAPVVLQDREAAGVACNTPICLQSQDLYVDGHRIDAVTSPDFVTEPNLWYFDRARGMVMVKFDPTQTEVEFGGPSVTAINCLPSGRPEILGVVIKDLTIEKYPSPPQTGSVQCGGGGEMRNCTVRFSHGYGIRLLGPVKLIECHIHNNGLAGVGGSGAGSLIYRCEINDNIWSYYFGLAWDSGGIKLANTNNVTFRNNYFHHNKGPGLWTDIKTQDVLIEENIVELNDWEGILPELSNHITLRKNVCRWNGVNPRKALWGGQICVQNSSHILLDSNYIETGPGNVSRWGNPQGFMAFNQDHRQSDEQRFSGDFGLRNLTVTGNLFLMPNGGANGLEYGKLGWPTYADFLNSGIVWSNNRYLVGRPLFLQWAWWSETNWPNNSAVGLSWDDWTKVQDQTSTLEIFGPEQFPPTSTNQHALIKEVTGLDYPVLKAQLSYTADDSPVDTDGDGLPEAWESRYFRSASVALPTDDGDQDGLSNLQEFTNRTNPLEADTDEDSVPDGWEVANKLNPLIYDSSVDLLLDGRSAREVYEDSLLSQAFTSFAAPSLQSAISLWLATSSGVTVDQNSALISWKDQGPHKLKVSWPSPPSESWPSPPTLAPDSPSAAGMVNMTGSFLNVSGQVGQWGREETGFTASFVFQPTELDISRQWRAIMSNEIYLLSGFRLRLESGYLAWSSYQNAGTLNTEGNTRLLPGQTYIITLLYGGVGRTSSIYVNGKPEAFGIPGKIVPSSAPMRLCGTGGIIPQPSRFGDVTVFNRLLSHQERRSLEGFLTQKFFTTLPEGSDRDGDGLPDTWENTYGLDTLTPNALSDEDSDGATNLKEFASGLDPVVADSDRDGLPDGWEVLWGTNPLQTDSNLDPDLDGLSHLDEFQNGSDPFTSDLNPPFLAFNKRRLWWRADSGLETGPSGLVRWTNSAAGAIHAIPQDASAPAITAPEPWKGFTVIRLSANALVSSTPVNPISVLHQAGITVTAVVRPPLVTPPAGFKRLMSFNGTMVGVDSGKVVLRNESGSLIAASLDAIPTTPFVMTLMISAAPEAASLQINGVTVLQLDGLPSPASSSFVLGGGDAWPADVAEIIVHASALPPLHRRFAERVLLGKWLGSGPLIGDVDGDTLPDWWEHEACSDASLADASDDSDWDGISNKSAYLEKRPGFVWRDADDDGMHDAWESLQGLDPQINDAEADPDADDISNAMEHALLTSPRSVESNDPWSIANALTDPVPSIRLRLRASQRSWARRARWESSSSLEPGTWSWVPLGEVMSRGAGATAIEETGLYPSEESGQNRSLIRLKLLDE
jgi:hypothetical protein